MKNKKVLITSALPYVNNHPHLGNLIGSVLSGDCFARYCRLKGNDVLFIGGTDEYGTPTEVQAIKENCTPIEICDKYHDIHKKVYEWFDCSFDIFGRTTNSEHKKISQDIFKSLYDNDHILKKSVSQLYCEKCDRFLADRYVEGKCYHCSSEGARGDQCDSCSNLIDATKLGNPKCKLCSFTPIVRDSDHLFLDLKHSAFLLEEWQLSVMDNWTKDASSITKGWMKKGLEPRCISRDLKWGISIPLEGYENKVFYVWFDAPIGYISITASYFNSDNRMKQVYDKLEELSSYDMTDSLKRAKQLLKEDYPLDEVQQSLDQIGDTLNHVEKNLEKIKETWEDWWQNPEVDLYEFMGKDNIPFHSIIFLATLMGTNDVWTLPKALYTTDYLNYEDGKFSKSRNVGVFCTDAMELGLPSFVWRYYLFSIRPESGDTSFRWDDFVNRNNSELLGKFGNYCNRILSFCNKFYSGVLPKYQLEGDDIEFMDKINQQVENYCILMDKGCLRDALRIVIDIASEGNIHLNKVAPWKCLKSDKIRADTSIVLGCNLIYLLSHLCQPFLPTLSNELESQLNYGDSSFNFTYEIKLMSNHVISRTIKPLVPTITKEQKENFVNKFGKFGNK
jgi:methionyl-tRNA synthetase